MDTCVLWNLTSIYRPERPAMQELVRLILANGANPNDLVQDIGMTDRSDQDRRDRDPGTFLITALHDACVYAHCKRHLCGVNDDDPAAPYTVVRLLMEARGDPNRPAPSTGRTALQYARTKRDKQLLALLRKGQDEGPSAEAPRSPPPRAPEKRVRRSTPIAKRAEYAGVSANLKALPDPPPSSATDEEMQQHKKTLQKVQIANQQIVSRAEAAKAKHV